MPTIQFWDDKLTEEIQIIQTLVASRDGIHTTAEDDQHIDKLFRDAIRTRRCYQSQTKLMNQEEQECYLPRFKLLDRELSALESEWIAKDDDDDDNSINVSDVFEDGTEATHEDTGTSLTNSSLEALGKDNEHPRPMLMRSTGAIRLDRTDASKLRIDMDTAAHRSAPILKRIRGVLHLGA